jgi:LUD domain
VTITFPDPGAPNREFERPADRAMLEQTASALAARGFLAEIAESADHARKLVLDAIPEGAEVHVALSETMRELGVTAEIDESGRYDSVRVRLNKLDRNTQRRERQKTGAAPDYVLGSAHAITADGQIVIGSGSGSQLGAHAYSAGNVILVVGHQKLVANLDEGLRRLQEYSLPREWERMQQAGRPGTLLAKTLIIHYELGDRIRVILVPETLGF